MSEVEGWDTDGSRDAEESRLRRHLSDCQQERQILQNRVRAGLAALDVAIDRSKPGGELQKELRRIRMLFDGTGMKLTGTERAEKVIEEWLQDPERNVFGLAADVLNALKLSE
jgi:hypothetical protein